MRDLPFPAGSFDAVLGVQSIEHVPDARIVLDEVVRVLRPGGVAVLVTPNRLTFGRSDEIVDPYHHVEYDAGELHALLHPFFAALELRGLFGSPRYLELVAAERRRLDTLLRTDPLRLRRLVPRPARQRLYDALLRRSRKRADPRAAAITPEDFTLRDGPIDDSLDLVALGRLAA
jgi:SAM-dependent methyltransferase